ncbi:MAG: radical SAM protein [Candidatus Eremiobacteraeota bacterium]|nr:radical SAM protein [Candidatus Eremiobacteraeota bacterium]
MSHLLRPKQGIIYGPVHSRRLGLSLGVNLMPPGAKTCSFDCVYCQYGWTDRHVRGLQSGPGFPTVPMVREALGAALEALPVPPDYITFSGNGEATLHPDFGAIAGEVAHLRDRYAPSAKTTILSNSSMATSIKTREALAGLDAAIMKLDCGDQAFFQRYNRPCGEMTLGDIVLSLSELAVSMPVIIQALFASGADGNFTSEHVHSWIECLKAIKSRSIQLYTLDRGHPARDLKPLEKEELEMIRDLAVRAGLPVQVY